MTGLSYTEHVGELRVTLERYRSASAGLTTGVSIVGPRGLRFHAGTSDLSCDHNGAVTAARLFRAFESEAGGAVDGNGPS